MTEVTDQEDVVMEGVVEAPNARRKVFSSTTELGKWLEMTKPKALQVSTERTQKGLQYVLLTQKG